MSKNTYLYDQLKFKTSLAGKVRKLEEDVYGVIDYDKGFLADYKLPSPIQDEILKIREQIDNLPEPMLYIGDWNASTNDPYLDLPDETKAGYVYTVTDNGEHFGIVWTSGDVLVINKEGYAVRWDLDINSYIRGECDTPAATETKEVTIRGGAYVPQAGDVFLINFKKGNSVGSPKLNINGTGAKNIRLSTTNASTTTFTIGANTMVMLIYDGQYYQLTGSYRTTDSNTYDRMQLSVIQVGDTVQGYKILMEGVDGKYYPLTLENSTGVTKTVSDADFKVGGNIVYYTSTAVLAPDATTPNCFSQIPTAYAGYTFNKLSGYQAYRPIYLKGTIVNGAFKLDRSSYTSWFTQDLPTSEDGFVYIYVGYMYSTAAYLRLMQYHPMYEYKDGRVRLYVPEHTHSEFASLIKGSCDTAAGTAAKVVTLTDPNYIPQVNDIFLITFTKGNSVSNPTLNINGTGAKNIRLGTTNASTTTFTVGAGAQVMLLFDGTYYNLTGSYRTTDKDTNTYDRMQVLSIQVGYPIEKCKLLMEGVDGRYYPLTLENSTGTTKTVSTVDFKVGGNIVYYGQTTPLAPDTIANCYSEIPTSFAGYTFNKLTGYKPYRPIYIKGTITNGVFKLDNSSYTSWFTQDLPTTEDGFVYIYVGYMFSTNADLRLMPCHPIYEFKDGSIRLYVPEHTHSDYALRSELPTIPSITVSNGAAETGKYIKSISASGHTITVVKDTLPSGGGGSETRTLLGVRSTSGTLSLSSSINSFKYIEVQVQVPTGEGTSSEPLYYGYQIQRLPSYYFIYEQIDPFFGGEEIRGGALFTTPVNPFSSTTGTVFVYQNNKAGTSLRFEFTGLTGVNVTISGIN